MNRYLESVGNTKMSNITVIGVQKRRKRIIQKKYLKKKNDWNIFQFDERILQIQEGKQTQMKVNITQTMSGHIIVKLLKNQR